MTANAESPPGVEGTIVRFTHLCLMLGVLAAAMDGNAGAETLPQRYWIHDGAGEHEYELAADELRVVTQPSRVLRIASSPSAEALREYAEGLKRSAGGEVELVLYEVGMPHNEFTRRVLTRQVLVHLTPKAAVDPIITAAGGLSAKRNPELGEWWLCEATAVDGAPALAERLRRQPGVVYAEAQLRRQHQAKLLPNDPFFPTQWHLLNTGQNGGLRGMDINLVNVWDTWRGQGVCVGIVDDGLQVTHPDLKSNVNAEASWNFNDNTSDPSPNLAYDDHGTAVAGLVAASGNNALGVVGVAFEAQLAGLRLLGDADTDEQDAAAMLHSNAVIQVKNNSWGAYDGLGALEGPGPLMVEALAQGTTSGRDGKGTIYVFAAGNGGAYGEDANYDGFANSINVIAVGAINDQGQEPSYGEPGACLTVGAPSRSAGRQGITTTDLIGSYGASLTDYRSDFGGTSASTPIASGVVALMLQANPRLGYRDVKEILLRSATKVQPQDSDWFTNSAGVAHNHRFGAGLLNAGAAMLLSTNWACLEPAARLSWVETNLHLAIPDNDPTGITRSFVVTNSGFRVEQAVLRVTAPHGHYGDLAITLTSPGGTPSRLAELHPSSGGSYQAWPLMSVRHWGEQAQGRWTIQVADLSPAYAGALEALELDLFGTVPSAKLEAALTNGALSLTLRAPAAGWRYDLESSTDLYRWDPLAVLELGTTGEATYLEANPAAAVRFYRARLR